MTGQLDIFAPPPVHSIDPDSSRQAARKVAPRTGTQAGAILQLLRQHPGGLTTGEIQDRLFAHQPKAANKVPTRLRSLWELGLVERLSASSPWRGIPWIARDDIAPLLREFGGAVFLVYRVTTLGLGDVA